MRTGRRLAVAALLASTLVLLPHEGANACLSSGDCSPTDTSGGGSPDIRSDPTVVERYATPRRSCSVYANGTGMGSHCVHLGVGTRETLRERFGGQKLQRCRYSPVPPGIEAPPTGVRTDGTYLMMSCLGNVDFDTYSGGPNRTLDVAVAFVPDGTDTADRHNPLTDFLWDQATSGTQLPVPVVQPRPITVPVVGAPTTLTFDWIDPATHDVVGPVRQITTDGLTLRAAATTVLVDPQQSDLDAVRCSANSTPGRPDACTLTFPRSSASARKHATEPIPADVTDAFHLRVEVEWRITYGETTGTMRTLGDGFTMRLRQPLPVQEVQAPNVPPSVVW